MKIKVIDFLSYANSHVKVNSSFLGFLPSSADITFLAEKEHSNYVKRNLVKEINFTTFKRDKFWRLKRELIFLFVVVQSLIKMKLIDSKDDRVLILGATGVQIFLLSIIFRAINKSNRQFHLILHSELEGFDNKPGINRKLAKAAFSRFELHKRCLCAVLSDHIKDNLIKISPEFEIVHSVRHPFLVTGEINIRKRNRLEQDLIKSLKLAVVGLIREDTKDLKLAKEIDKIQGINVAMYGRASTTLNRDALTNDSNVVSFHYEDSWIEQQLSDTDFLLLVPKPNSYRFTALGTVADSVSYGIPLVWISHDALNDYSNFPFSVVCKDLNEIRVNLSNFAPPEEREIEEWVTWWNAQSRREFAEFIKFGLENYD